MQVFKENKNAYPDKIYDYVSKSNNFNVPSIKFKNIEHVVKTFYAHTDLNLIIRAYRQYTDAVGINTNNHSDTLIMAVRHSLRTIAARYSDDTRNVIAI